MTRVVKSVLVPHSPQKMCALVEDIPSYPQFLPWCSGTEIHETTAAATTATIHIHFHGLRQQFTTRNEVTPGQRLVMNLVKGPFQHLQGEFSFTPLGEGACKIVFTLEWRFSNAILEKIVGPVFHTIANSMVDAFVKRADAVYGSAAQPHPPS